MSTANAQIRIILLIVVIMGLLAFAGVHIRNYAVQKTYRGQAQDIRHELNSYKMLNDINNEIWSDNDLKKTESLIKKAQKLSPDSKELKESKKYLLAALEYIQKAQKESGLSVSQIQLDTDQAKLSAPKEYLEKANTESARSTEHLKEFEKTHKALFQ